jgi:hypothetical protein
MVVSPAEMAIIAANAMRAAHCPMRERYQSPALSTYP